MSADKVSEKKGECLCGKVKVTAKKAKQSIGVCHCETCRKRSGGPLFAVDCGSDVSFEGKDHISVYQSSDWAERAFCKNCGTNLYYRLKQQNLYFVASGMFSGDDSFVFDHEVFIDSKPKFYDFKNNTKKITGAELFAQYS